MTCPIAVLLSDAAWGRAIPQFGGGARNQAHALIMSGSSTDISLGLSPVSAARIDSEVRKPAEPPHMEGK